MSRTTDAIEWLRPFHEATSGRTEEMLDAAMAAIDSAPDPVRGFVEREGLRAVGHTLRRTASIRVNGDAETMPLFVATEDEDGMIVHRMRPTITVAEVDDQIARWGKRRAQANRELSWWTHQRDLATDAGAPPSETLRGLWDRLGVAYQIVGRSDEAAVAL